MKKLINDPKKAVEESLHGFALAHPNMIRAHFDPMWVERSEPKESGKVALVSGGGSGHEPLHLGFVGTGMLDAAVPGPIFTSPTPDPIVEATKAVDQGEGVLYIVKNYTGDVLNFETAAELASLDGIAVETIIIDDDCAVEDSLYTAGRRGVAGTVLVEKIVGAAAEEGQSLNELAQLGKNVNDRMRSMGLALGPCTVPHVGVPSFKLDDDEIEMGIGIHGEPGYRRGKMRPADVLTEEIYEKIRDDLSLARGEKVIALVNGMGATPLLELYIVMRRLNELLEEDGIKLERALVNNYVTSLDMPGVSITLLQTDPLLTHYFDAPTNTVGWTQVGERK